MRNLWCVLCKDIITDKDTGMVSYISCLESIVASRLPANLPPVSIGTCWKKEGPGDTVLKIRVACLDPAGVRSPVYESPEIEMKGERHKVNLNLGGFPIAVAGTYVFAVEYLSQGQWLNGGEVELGIFTQSENPSIPPGMN